MDLKLLASIFLCCIGVACTQQSERTSESQGPSNFYCNAWSDTGVGNNQNFNLAQGKPGKIGPIGPVGEKGQKGERGQSDDTAAELTELEKNIEEQNERIEELQSLVFNQLSSCAAVGTVNHRRSGYYWISPDKNHLPIRVFCNFTSPSSPETIISHDHPIETQRENCEEPRCAKHPIVYYATMQQIVAIINQSAECRQFIKYRCTYSVLFGRSFNPYAAWFARDGMPQYYWGGTTSQRKGYCACGETDTCATSVIRCNCDANDQKERFDEGFLTDKDKLPVTELQFGDAGASNEKSWFTLGPLICSGQSE